MNTSLGGNQGKVLILLCISFPYLFIFRSRIRQQRLSRLQLSSSLGRPLNDLEVKETNVKSPLSIVRATSPSSVNARSLKTGSGRTVTGSETGSSMPGLRRNLESGTVPGQFMRGVLMLTRGIRSFGSSTPRWKFALGILTWPGMSGTEPSPSFPASTSSGTSTLIWRNALETSKHPAKYSNVG